MKVEHTKSGNVKIVLSLQQALSLEKVLGNISHTDIVSIVHNHNPDILITYDDTTCLGLLWVKLDEELIGYYV